MTITLGVLEYKNKSTESRRLCLDCQDDVLKWIDRTSNDSGSDLIKLLKEECDPAGYVKHIQKQGRRIMSGEIRYDRGDKGQLCMECGKPMGQASETETRCKRCLEKPPKED
jgi:hypothetical protein